MVTVRMQHGNFSNQLMDVRACLTGAWRQVTQFSLVYLVVTGQECSGQRERSAGVSNNGGGKGRRGMASWCRYLRRLCCDGGAGGNPSTTCAQLMEARPFLPLPLDGGARSSGSREAPHLSHTCRTCAWR